MLAPLFFNQRKLSKVMVIWHKSAITESIVLMLYISNRSCDIGIKQRYWPNIIGKLVADLNESDGILGTSKK